MLNFNRPNKGDKSLKMSQKDVKDQSSQE